MIKVLVVDDEMFVRRGIVMETDWASLGCVVVAEAANGEEGLEAARNCQPDLIITDIRMPKMNGIDMVRKLREEGNQSKVIFLTAYGEFEYARSAIKLLVPDYILKPFEDGELEQAVLRIRDEEKQRGEEKRNKEQEEFLAVSSNGVKNRYISEALQYIAGHYSDWDISVKEIAEALRLSEGYLSHLFKKETGCTVASYVTRCRISMAMKLLASHQYKVYEVAEQVGYRDITYFSSTFKKMTGISPSEYLDRC